MPVKKVIVEKANRLYQLAPDILSLVRPEARRSILKKTKLLDLAGFNWPVAFDATQMPEPPAFAAASTEKLDNLKEELASWYATIHGARLNAAKEVFIGGSVSSTILATALAFLDNGDIAFVPDLGLPLYRKSVTACGGEPVGYSVSTKDVWRPNFERVGTRLGRVARVLFINSPHNPTGAELTEKDVADLVWLAGRENIIVVNDAAYQTVSGRKTASLMAATGGRKVGIEIGSFTYMFGLPTLPFGFAVGNKDIISGLEAVSSLMRPFVPGYYVDLALDAIRQFPARGLQEVRRRISQASAEATKLLDILKLERTGYDTIPFIWAKIERRRHAARTAKLLVRRTRILVVPGSSFGENGEGFLRFSLTASPETYRAACERLKRKRQLAKLVEDQ